MRGSQQHWGNCNGARSIVRAPGGAKLYHLGCNFEGSRIVAYPVKWGPLLKSYRAGTLGENVTGFDFKFELITLQ